MSAGRRTGVTILQYRRRNEMKAGWRWDRLLALAGAAAIALIMAGCGTSDETQAQATDNADLRAIVASDQQQIIGLQQKVGQLNDQLTELQHNGGGTDQAALQKQVAELQAEVNATKPGASATPGAPGGGPNAEASPAANGFPAGVAAEPGASPSMASNEPPPPPEPGPSSSMTGEPEANASPGAAANEEESDDDNNGNEVASNPPPAAPAPMNGGVAPWQSQIDPQLGAAASSSDPAAKPYTEGLIALKSGRYPQALGSFQDLQRRYPKSPLSEPAEYFAANALYEMGKYEQAILEFNDVTMRFPNGKFASASMLREAQAFQKINDQIDARLTLQKLVSDHPDSPEAAAAKSMMQGMANG